MEDRAVNPDWRKSTYSANGGGECVEVGRAPKTLLIRDTKDNGRGPVLRVPPAAWHSFTASVRAGQAIS